MLFYLISTLFAIPSFTRDSRFDLQYQSRHDLQLRLKKRFGIGQKEQSFSSNKGRKSISMKYKQQYIRKIQYQSLKLLAFYNQSTVPTKKQNKRHFLYESGVKIVSPLDLMLSLDEVLKIEQNHSKLLLPAPTHICTILNSEVRLGLILNYKHNLSALRLQYVDLIKSISLNMQKQIKAVEHKNSQRKRFKICLYNLCRWLRTKIFKKSHQTYVLLVASGQQKSISFFQSQKIKFVQTCPNRYLVYPEIQKEVRQKETYLKQCQFYQSLFGPLFTQYNNLILETLSQQKMRYYLDNLQPSSHVREFLLDCKKKIQQYNLSKLRSLGLHFQKDNSIKQILKSNTEKDMSLTQQPDLLTVIQAANQDLRQNGFFSLVESWKYVLKPKLQDSFINFQMYETHLKDHLLLFVRLHELCLMKIQQYLKKKILRYFQSQKVYLIYETIYPNITKINQKLLQNLGAQKLKFYQQKYIKKNEKIEMSHNQLETQFVSIICRQLCCSEDIPNQNLVLQRIKQFIADSEYANQNRSEPSPSNEAYFANIQNERISNNNCLGCSTFFYQHMNMYQPSLNQVPLKIFKDINILRDNTGKIIDIICGLLNRGGGIILFGFHQSLGQFKSYGMTLKQKQKQALEDRMLAIMNLIYPRIDQRNWILNFVPVYENPLQSKNISNLKMTSYKGIQQLMKPNQSFVERNPLKGVYVGRLILKPADTTKLYMYSFKKQKNNEKFYSSSFENGSIKQIPLCNVRKILKKKIKAHYIPEYMRCFQNTMLKRYAVFDHDCVPPQAGRPLVQTKSMVLPLYKKQSSVQIGLGFPQFRLKI